MAKTNLSTTNLNMIKLKSPAEWQGIFYVGQDRTATERNYVANLNMIKLKSPAEWQGIF